MKIWSREEIDRRKNGQIPATDIGAKIFLLAEDGKPKATSLTIGWSVDGIGFGQMVLNIDEKGNVASIDSETMSREFVKRVLAALVDQAKEVS